MKKELCRIRPEEAGVASEYIEHFLDRLKENEIPMHRMMMIRGGKVFAEGYWAPWTEQSRHRMFSITKSFVSLAIGLLQGQGKLCLQERVIDFFPEHDSLDLHPWVREMVIEDLLKMATPFSEQAYTVKDTDWAEAFFKAKPSHQPGTIFSYDTAGTVILNMIAERICGTPFFEYLWEYVLKPIGVEDVPACIQTPTGESWGGSGVLATLDMVARTAILLMNDGEHEGRQLLPKEYVRAAISKQIDTGLNEDGAIFQKGYGYQIWRFPENGFGFWGMGGQLACCFPEKQMIFLCNADTQGIDGAENLILNMWLEEVYHKTGCLNNLSDEKAWRRLKERLTSLKMQPKNNVPLSESIHSYSGRRFIMESNPMGLKYLEIYLNEGNGELIYENTTGIHSLLFGIGAYISGEFPEKQYFGMRIKESYGRGYKCLCAGWQTGEKSIMIDCRIVDFHIGNLQMMLAWKENEISLKMQKHAEWFLEEYQGFASGKEIES